jgi:methylated-DNA-[protein]-cysteine S-methyltransferase
MALACTVLPAPGPIGALTLGVTDQGLALVAFGAAPDAAARAAARLGEPLVEDAGATAAAAAQLAEYLAGER